MFSTRILHRLTRLLLNVFTQVSFNYLFNYFLSEGSGDWTTCSKSFLFSLVNFAGVGPTKMALKTNNKQHGIYCKNTYGPTFGGGHDLHICNAANESTGSSSNFGHTYESPQSGATFLVGQRKFTVNEYEVFGYQR